MKTDLTPRILLAAAALFTYAAIIWVFWVGFLGSDDALYWAGSTGWLTRFPYVGADHWGLRHTLTIPIALARWALGDGLVALSLSCLVYAGGSLVILAMWLARVSGVAAAAAALLLVVTNPLLVVWSSTAAIDVVELFFVLAAFALYARAVTNGPAGPGLLVAGMLMGLAYLSRETASFGVAAFGVLFLAGYGFARKWYVVIAAGFALVMGGELLYFRVMTGSFLYRLTLSAHHDATINRWAATSGIPFAIHPLVDPLLMLATNHYFGLLSWVGVPLAIWLLRQRGLSRPLRQTITIFAVLGLIWALIAALLWGFLPLIPRYFLLPSICVSVLAGIAIHQMLGAGRRRLGVVCAVLLLLGNLASLTLENKNFRYGEWALADIAGETQGVIHTDLETRSRASLLLEWRGLADRVVTSPAQPGEISFYNSIEAARMPPVGANWEILISRAPPPTWLQVLLQPISARIPPGIFEKFGPRHPGVTLYMVR